VRDAVTARPPSEEVRVAEPRSAAYADLLQALLAVRSDPATARFDAELAQAEAEGRIDGPTARALRWWQRETLRGLADHLSDVLPEVLDRLSAADAAARDAVDESEQSWKDATRSLPAVAAGSVASGDGSRPGTSPVTSTPPPPASPPERFDGGSHLRPVDPIDALPAGGAPAGDPRPPAPRLLRPGFVPDEHDPRAHRLYNPGVPRTRLIAGGLTVAGDGQHAATDRRPAPSTDPYGLAR
jgi:hypothetical protein